MVVTCVLDSRQLNTWLSAPTRPTQDARAACGEGHTFCARCIGDSRSGPAGAFKHDGDGVTSTIIVVLLVLAVVGVAVAEATGKLRPKKVGEAGVGIYEGSAGVAGVGEVVENTTAPQSL